MKKILIIAYYWPPSGGPGVQRVLQFVKYLPQFDVMPIVLTVDEKYASYPIIDQSLVDEVQKDIKVYKTKSVEVLSLYKKLNKNKLPNPSFSGEKTLPSLLKKITRFIRGNFFIPDPRKGWNKYCYIKAKQLIKKYNIDTVVVSTPPHSTQLVGMKLKKKLAIKYIADFRDPWLGAYYTKGMYKTKLTHWIERQYEKSVLNSADKIILVSAKDILQQKINNKSKIHFIPNGFDESLFKVNIKPSIFPSTFEIAYFGSLSPTQPIYSFIEACGKLVKENNHIDIKLKFVGAIGQQVKELCKKENIEVDDTDYIPYQEALGMMMKAHILFLIIPNIKEYTNHLPGKLFEYIATKNPIVCLGGKTGLVNQIIQQCNTGKTFDYKESQNEIFYFLNEKLRHWEKGRNIRFTEKYHLKYSRKNLTQKFTEIL